METDLPASSEPPSTTPTNLNLPPVSTPYSLSPRKHFSQLQTPQEKRPETHTHPPTSFFLNPSHDGRDLADFRRIPTLTDIDNVQTQPHTLPPSFTLPVPMEESVVQTEYMQSLKTTLTRFWENENLKIERLSPYTDEMFEYEMPLARIKKIMRFDPSVVMIGADAPILLSKACELILREIATRAWYHTNQARRRTIKHSDLVTALALPKTSVFDFLVDFIPREQQQQQQQQQTIPVPAPLPAPMQEPVEEEVEISDREKSKKDLENLIRTAIPELSNMEPERGLVLPDVRTSNFPNTKWDELERLSKSELQDFPEDCMPLMLALLRSAFEHTPNTESNKKMKF